jgi:hypothetical protein
MGFRGARDAVSTVARIATDSETLLIVGEADD